MPRNGNTHHRNVINIGFLGERYEKEVKSFYRKTEIDGEMFKFVQDHIQLDNGAAYGRWVREVDYVNA